MFRELPRAGMKVDLGSFSFGVKASRRRECSLDSFEDKFKDWLGTKYAFTVSSGRAALYLILKVLKKINKKNTVIIPAYICPTVPLAIARADLNVRVCDISKSSFDFDYSQLSKIVGDETLCIILAHLAGFSCNLDGALEAVGGDNTLIVEDCAQSMGAEYKGKKVGLLGSFGFFSLGRGKGMTTYSGGIIITNEEKYPQLISTELDSLSQRNSISNFLDIVKLLGYIVFFHPRLFFYVKWVSELYWRIRNLPLHAENEYHRIDFKVKTLSGFQRGVGCSLLKRLDDSIEGRRRKGKYLTDCLEGVNGVRVLKEVSGSKSTYLLLPIIFEDPKKCEKVFRALKQKGLGASKLYTGSINQYEYLNKIIPGGNFPNAESIAKRTLTLPTHSYVTQSDMDKMINVIEKII